jgi:hypothetical protein
MEYLSWDLAILSRAVAYTNLSGASSHVGLSQPQLSRIVAKLEEQFGLTLLDRETKRKSSWTPAAYRLSEIYLKTFQSFRSEVSLLAGGLEPTHLRIGTLEGLTPLAMRFCNSLYKKTALKVIELDVHDTSQLEERFLKNDLDLLFSSREPGRKKFRFTATLGYQSIETYSGSTGFSEPRVFSMFEYVSEDGKSPKDAEASRIFVSNSLRVRQEWIDTYGGTGTLPSAVLPQKSGKKNEVPVLLIAHDQLPASFWSQCEEALKIK